MEVRYVTKLDRVEGLSKAELEELAKVSSEYQFRANDYYLSLINWNDPKDPTRKIVIPHAGEIWTNGEALMLLARMSTRRHRAQRYSPASCK